MNYTIKEVNELSAYAATLQFDQNISDYLNTDDFAIYVRDMYTNDVITIDKNNINNYGINDTDPVLENRLENSLCNNGMVIYLPDSKSLYVKQLIKCTTSANKAIGYDSSEFDIWLTNTDTFTIYSNLFPKLQRDPSACQVDSGAEDPVLPSADMRNGFNYDESITPGIKYLNSITADYEAGNTSAIYVNTDISVPCYYSTVSAFMNTDMSATVSSYLYDNDAQTFIDIPYEESGPTQVDLDLPHSLSATVNCYEYKQFIKSDGDDLYKNRLMLTISADKIETI